MAVNSSRSMNQSLADGSTDGKYRKVRRKKFDIIPMTEEEAIEQMKLLGHDNFFIFYNAKASSSECLPRSMISPSLMTSTPTTSTTR